MATSTRAHVSQSSGCRCRFRYGHVHAERGRGLAHGLAPCRTALCRPDADGKCLAIFCFCPAGRIDRRHCRSQEIDFVYRSVDGGNRNCACRRDHRRTHVSPIVADPYICPLCGRCVRDPKLAGGFARTGPAGGPRIGFGAQRHRVQFCPGGRTGAGWGGHRGVRSWYSIRPQCRVLCWRHRGGRPLEAPSPQTIGAGGDFERRHRRGHPLRALFAGRPHCVASVRCRHVLRQRASGAAAFRGPRG